VRQRDKIFISYSRLDSKWLDELLKHIKPHVDIRQLTWADTAIEPGALWQSAIQDSLNSAQVAVLLVTSNFLASNFILEFELPRIIDDAESKQVTVAWISASASGYKQTSVARYQCLNDPTRPLDTLSQSDLQAELVTIAEDLHKLHDRRPESRPHSSTAAPVTAAAMTINLDYWRQDISTNHRDCADRLIRGERLTDDDRLYTALEVLIERSIESRLIVEAAIPSSNVTIRINGPTHYWALLIGRSVLDTASAGPLKWLIEATKQQLSKCNPLPESLLMEVWRYLCQFAQPQSPTLFVERVIAAAVESVERNRDPFYPFVLLLYNLLEKDPMGTRSIGQQLQNFVETLGDAATPSFLTALKRLVGRGLTASAAAPSMPTLAQMGATTLVPYGFEASVHPLTVYENALLRGIIPTKLKEQALYPFAFEIVSTSGEALLNKLV
jgi:hypothetical protein